MNATVDAILCSWPYRPGLWSALAIAALVYMLGYCRLSHGASERFGAGRPMAFFAALAATLVALGSPVEVWADLLLEVHMVQHLLLLLVVPPLVWLAWPLIPLLRGLPAGVRRGFVLPLLKSRGWRSLARRVTHPIVALVLMTLATWAWHVPAAYELALRSTAWHYVQHASLLAAGLAFWFAVVRPYPSRPAWSTWLLLPTLLLADVQNTALAALFSFSSRVLYPHYAAVPRWPGLSALEDQARAGAIMWVPGSIALLVPLAVIGVRLLLGETGSPRQAPRVRKAAPRPVVSSVHPGRSRIDLLALPVVGRLISSKHSRTVVRMLMLLFAAALIYDGFRGPQVAGMNLAGVLPWIHWRGLLVIGLLAAGNVFCFACPFMLPRAALRRWLAPRWEWPRVLRNKWLAVGLTALFLWAYEAWSLWDRPAWTAGIAFGYLVAVLAVDGLFRGASFCKYVCPIGQFNFVHALVSPAEIRVRDPARCTSCTTHECLRGSATSPGCELDLFQPRKSGNLDCTFCLDCARACPHANVGWITVTPARELWRDRLGSGIGRVSARPDLTVLVLLLVFGAWANAAGMIEPVIRAQATWQSGWPWAFGLSGVTTFYLVALLIVPALAVTAAAACTRYLSGQRDPLVRIVGRYCWSLVPLGFSMWAAHYAFHFFTSYAAVLPPLERWSREVGLSLRFPEYACSCCAPAADWLLKGELLLLDFGLLVSLATCYRISRAASDSPAAAWRACFSWALLIVLLFAAGVAILFEPMQMRGTLGG